MYLDHTFGLRLSFSEITSVFGQSRYIHRIFVQGIGSTKVSQKVKSPNVPCETDYLKIKPAMGIWVIIYPGNFYYPTGTQVIEYLI